MEGLKAGAIAHAWLCAWGAKHMATQDRYGPAAVAPWLALFPLSPLGWPAAIWGFWAMSRPGVRSLFRSEQPPARSA